MTRSVLPDRILSEGRLERSRIEKFGGYVRRETCGGKDICEMKNMSTDNYPALSARGSRRYLLNGSANEQPYTVNFAGAPILSRGGSVYRLHEVDDALCEAEVIFSGADGARRMAGIKNGVMILPDYIYYDLDTDTYTSMVVNTGIVRSATIGTNTLRIEGLDLYDIGFRRGDGIRITSGGNLQSPLISGDYVLKSVMGDTCLIEGEFLTTGTFSIYIERYIPELEYLCAVGERIFGCMGNKIYACEEGNPFNWVGCKGKSSDPICIESSSQGDFTASALWQGYPIFFKRDRIAKLLGNGASSYTLSETPAPGVPSGSSLSVASVAGMLYYHGAGGIYRYSGSYPQCISHDLAGRANGYSSAVGGSDGRKYYVSLKKTGAGTIFCVYDPDCESWCIEDDSDIISMSGSAGVLYMLTRGGTVLAVGDTQAGVDEPYVKGLISGYAGFGYDDCGVPDSKRLLRVYLNAYIPVSGSLSLYTEYDGEDTLHLEKKVAGSGKEEHIQIDIAPNRCHAFRIRIDTVGKCIIRSVTREYRIMT